MCKIDGSLFISLSFLVIISVPPRAGEAQRDWSHRGSALAQTEWYVSRRAWDQTGGPLFACHMCSDFACASELRYQIWWLIPWPFLGRAVIWTANKLHQVPAALHVIVQLSGYMCVSHDRSEVLWCDESELIPNVVSCCLLVSGQLLPFSFRKKKKAKERK